MDIDKDLWSAAISLFEGDQNAAVDWLHQPAPALGDVPPIQAPLELVLDLIGRLEHGIVT